MDILSDTSTTSSTTDETFVSSSSHLPGDSHRDQAVLNYPLDKHTRNPTIGGESGALPSATLNMDFDASHSHMAPQLIDSPSNYMKNMFEQGAQLGTDYLYDQCAPAGFYGPNAAHFGGQHQPNTGLLIPKMEMLAQQQQHRIKLETVPMYNYDMANMCSYGHGTQTPVYSANANVQVNSAVPDSTSNHNINTRSEFANGMQDRRMSAPNEVGPDESARLPPACAPFAVDYQQRLRCHSVGTPPDYSPVDSPFPNGAVLPQLPPYKADANYPTPSNAQNGTTALSSKSYIPCKVCTDKASGYHYGVTSCEGCKGFFRRSIQKQIEYRCLREGKCAVFRLNRNRCQYCRFKKCLAVGMSRDSVRYGRVPKRSRERAEAENSLQMVTASDPVEPDSEQERKQLALYDIILCVTQANQTHSSFTDEKMKNIAHRPLQFPLERCQSMTGVNEEGSLNALQQQKLIMWETLALYTTHEIQQVVEFAKRVPSFADLRQDDQLILIKTGFFEIWLLRVARHANTSEQTLTLADGSFLTKEQLCLIYTPELVQSMMSFAAGLNNIRLHDVDIGLLESVVLLSQDRQGLHDSHHVRVLQAQLIEALELQLRRNHAADTQLFPKLFAMLPDLKAIGKKHHEVLVFYRLHWRRLELPPLCAEIYDVEQSSAPNNNNNNNNNTSTSFPQHQLTAANAL